MALLKKVLKDSDRKVSKEAFIALNKHQGFTKGFEKLIAQLGSYKIKVSQKAAKVLAKKGKKAVPALIMALKSDDWGTRRSAADALGMIGPDASEAIPHLIMALREKNKYGKISAVRALGKMGSKASSSIIPLAKLLIPIRDNFYRSNIIDALEKMGDKRVKAVPYIVRVMNKGNLSVNLRGKTFLKKLGDRALPSLIEVFNDNKFTVHSPSVAEITGSFGKKAVKASGGLVRMFSSGSILRTIATRKALIKIGKGAVPFLILGTMNRWSSVREESIRTLGEMGPRANSAVPALKVALNGFSKERRSAEQALKSILGRSLSRSTLSRFKREGRRTSYKLRVKRKAKRQVAKIK